MILFAYKVHSFRHLQVSAGRSPPAYSEAGGNVEPRGIPFI